MERRTASFDYWMGQADQRLGALEDGQAQLASELASLRREVESAFTWVRRLGLLAILWTGAIGLNLDPDLVVELVVKAIKLLLKSG